MRCASPPNRRSAAARASCAFMPAAMCSSIRRSTWSAYSSRISCSTRRPRTSERRRSRSANIQRISCLFQPHDERDGGGEALPVGGLAIQMTAAGRGEAVILGAPVVLAEPPLGGDPAFLFQLVQRGIQRTVAHLQDFHGDMLQAQPDSPRVQWFEREDLENQEVEHALQQIGRLTHGALPEVTEGSLSLLPSVIKGTRRS